MRGLTATEQLAIDPATLGNIIEVVLKLLIPTSSQVGQDYRVMYSSIFDERLVVEAVEPPQSSKILLDDIMTDYSVGAL